MKRLLSLLICISVMFVMICEITVGVNALCLQCNDTANGYILVSETTEQISEDLYIVTTIHEKPILTRADRYTRTASKTQTIINNSGVKLFSITLDASFIVQDLHHIPGDLRTLLQIRVDKADVVTVGMLQTSVEGRFLAEITGEGNDLGGAFFGFVELFQVVPGGIPAAIVHKNDFIIIAAARKSLDGSILEGCNIFCFIVAGDN